MYDAEIASSPISNSHLGYAGPPRISDDGSSVFARFIGLIMNPDWKSALLSVTFGTPNRSTHRTNPALQIDWQS
jgi:hypothetical protein